MARPFTGGYFKHKRQILHIFPFEKLRCVLNSRPVHLYNFSPLKSTFKTGCVLKSRASYIRSNTAFSIQNQLHIAFDDIKSVDLTPELGTALLKNPRINIYIPVTPLIIYHLETRASVKAVCGPAIKVEPVQISILGKIT
jgi:hypothetical protein